MNKKRLPALPFEGPSENANALRNILPEREDQQSVSYRSGRWTHVRENGLVVEVHEPDYGKIEELLDNHYEVRPCEEDSEDPERNEREGAAPYLKFPAQI